MRKASEWIKRWHFVVGDNHSKYKPSILVHLIIKNQYKLRIFVQRREILGFPLVSVLNQMLRFMEYLQFWKIYKMTAKCWQEKALN
jgi:hypothetical protein